MNTLVVSIPVALEKSILTCLTAASNDGNTVNAYYRSDLVRMVIALSALSKLRECDGPEKTEMTLPFAKALLNLMLGMMNDPNTVTSDYRLELAKVILRLRKLVQKTQEPVLRSGDLPEDDSRKSVTSPCRNGCSNCECEDR